MKGNILEGYWNILKNGRERMNNKITGRTVIQVSIGSQDSPLTHLFSVWVKFTLSYCGLDALGKTGTLLES